MAKRIQVGGRIESMEVGGIVTGAAEILDDARGKKQSVINGETDDELLRLDQSKQDNLTFDNAPTEGSDNPVKSGGVYAADKALSDAIEAILLLIPSAASALNKLVDTAMMNSSISTATATFRGTYNVVTDLSLTVDATHEQIAAALGNAISTADNNDYAFVQVPVSEESTDIRRTERYKFNGTAWGYEYDLNTSGFTDAQWAAINSGITLALVGKLIGLPTSAELQALLGQKQDTLAFDNIPVSGSANPVKSGGVYSAINDEKTAREQLAQTVTGIDGRVENVEGVIPTGAAANNKLVANNSMEAYVTSIIDAITASFTIATADGHINLTLTQTNGRVASLTLTSSDIASAQALTALTGRVTTAEGNITTINGNITSLGGRVSTNETDIANLQQLYNDLQQSKPVPVTDLPSTGQQQGVIYRLAGTTSYSDYMWNGSTWVLMATYNNAIDPRPKKASQNLVTSGGVFDNMGALDVSELNATENPHTLAQYVDLSAALAAIPTDYQKGGMSIKFVQSSDNKYVQYRYMGTATTGSPNPFLDTANWQGVDDTPTAGSDNLLKSGGTYKSIISNNVSFEKKLNTKIIGSWFTNILKYAILEYGSLDNQGNPFGNITRRRVRTTNYIPYNSDYVGTITGNGNYSFTFYEYDKDFLFIRKVDRTPTTASKYNPDTNCEYIKFLVSPNPDSAEAVLSFDDIISDVTLTVDVEYDKTLKRIGLSDIYNIDKDYLFTKNDLINGSVNNNGEVVSSTSRLVTQNLIPLSWYERIYIHSVYGLFNVWIACYDVNGTYLGYTSDISPANINTITELSQMGFSTAYPTTAYVRFVFVYSKATITLTSRELDIFDFAIYKIPLFSEKQNQIIDIISSFNDNILKYDFVHENLSGTPANSRLTNKSYIEIEQNTKYNILKLWNNNNTEGISIIFYDENKVQLYGTDYYYGDSFFKTYNEKYIRITYKLDDTSNRIPDDIVPPFALVKDLSVQDDVGIVRTRSSYWELGSIKTDGTPLDGNKRIRSNYIDVSKTGELSVATNSNYAAFIQFYNSSFESLGYTDYITARTTIIKPKDTNFIRVVVKRSDGDVMNVSESTDSGISIISNIIGSKAVSNITVSQWNCGKYHKGETPAGIPSADIERDLPILKNVLTEIAADILIINEEAEYVDTAHTMKTWDVLYKQFYSYKIFSSNGQIAIYSKYPISGSLGETSTGRKYIVGEVEINDEKIGFIACHLSPSNSANRITEAQELVAVSNMFTKCIIAGDLNTAGGDVNDGMGDADAELAPFVNAEMVLGNRGYWGAIKTYIYTSQGVLCIDNIIIKNGKITKYEVLNNASVSDHYPTVSAIVI